MRSAWLCCLFLSALAAACAPARVSAAGRAWDGGGANSDWFTAGNWDPNGAPAPADELSVFSGSPTASAKVTAGSGGWIALDGGGVSAALRDVYAGELGDGTIRLLNGASLSGWWGYIGYDADANGLMVVDGNAPGGVNSRATFTGRIHVGHDGSGRLEITRGGDLASNEGRVGYNDNAVGTVWMDGDGSTWTITYNLAVGDYGEGTMDVRNGAVVACRDGYVGSGGPGVSPERGQGSVTVSGDGSQWTCSRYLSVGHRDEGSLSILGGGCVRNTNAAYIGEGPDANGTVVVSGAGANDPSTWEAYNFTYVGYEGDGSLSILDGARVESAGVNIAYDDGVRGSVLVDGNESTWINAGSLFVGEWGVGSLTIRNGASVSNAQCEIGSGEFAEGTVLVEGAGSMWGSTSTIYVCKQGLGTLTVRDGAVVLTGGGFIGHELDANGAASVTGTGSTWTSLGDLRVGHSGVGSLSVAAGGVVINQAGQVGYNASAVGRVTVDGNGTTWQNTADLTVGYSGRGEVAVGGGAEMSSRTGYLAFDPGSTGVVAADGNGTAWRNSVDLYVGRRGAGTLSITGGARVTTPLLHVGDRSDGNGVVLVAGTDAGGTPSTLATGGQMYVAWSGPGSLTVRDGGLVTCASSEVGRYPTSLGHILVEGTALDSAPSMLRHDSYFYLASEGAASLTIRGGGTVRNALGVIGFSTGSDGNAVVEGPGSLWDCGGELHVGREGRARLTVRGGGAVGSSAGYVASTVQSTASAVVAGAGSAWTVASELSVGDRGTGTLDVLAGAGVSCQAGLIAPVNDANGRVTIDGEGSSWQVAGTLHVAGWQHGRGGRGVLDVRGGAVSVGQTLKVWRDGEVLLSGGRLDADAVSLDANAAFTFTGGRLSANAFDGDLTNAGGTTCPGRSLGTMTVDGNYVQAAAASLEIELGDSAAGPYDRLAVAGDAVLAGLLHLAVTGDPAYGEAFEVLSAGSLAGAFDVVTASPGDPDKAFAVLYGGQTVTVVVALPGDADLDGEVTPADLAALEAGWGLPAPMWANGDFDLDGDVDHLDYLAWKAHADWSIHDPARLPEPATLSLLLMGAGCLLRPRRPGRE